MSQRHSDRNLLLGILALQLDFVTREGLIAGMQAWVLDKQRRLEDIFVEQGTLQPSRRELLVALLQQHLAQHNERVEESLAALSSLGEVRQELAALEDVQVDATLSFVPALGSPAAAQGVLPSPPAAAGQRYRIIRPHREGGLGQVYVAYDDELRREVALKEIKREFVQDAGCRTRFFLEAEITGSLEHPGIVPVYGLGVYADGRPFYVMRFIQGDSLKDAIQEFHQSPELQADSTARNLRLRKLLGRLVDVCNAVAYAHSRGILHRDLKPGNIMLGKYGETLVVDWGLAKATGKRAAEAGLEERTLRPSQGNDEAITVAGSHPGTIPYMSPEQFSGDLERIGPTSDVYSLGATLFVLLTGSVPFDPRRMSRSQILEHKQGGSFPRPRALQPWIARPLEAICLKAMSSQSDERYSSATALAEDVERWLADEAVVAASETRLEQVSRLLRRHRNWVHAGLVSLTLVLLSMLVGLVLIAGAYQRERTAKNEAVKAAGERERHRLSANFERAKTLGQRGDDAFIELRFDEAAAYFVDAIEVLAPDLARQQPAVSATSPSSSSPLASEGAPDISQEVRRAAALDTLLRRKLTRCLTRILPVEQRFEAPSRIPLVLTAAGDQLITTDQARRTLTRRDTVTGEALGAEFDSPAPVRSAQFDLDERALFGHTDASLVVWSLQDERLLAEIPQFAAKDSELVVSQDLRYVFAFQPAISTVLGGRGSLYDLQRPELPPVKIGIPSRRELASLEFVRNNDFLVIEKREFVPLKPDVARQDALTTGNWQASVVSPDGRLRAEKQDKRVSVWDLESNHEVAAHEVADGVDAVAFSRNSRLLHILTKKGSAVLAWHEEAGALSLAAVQTFDHAAPEFGTSLGDFQRLRDGSLGLVIQEKDSVRVFPLNGSYLRMFPRPSGKLITSEEVPFRATGGSDLTVYQLEDKFAHFGSVQTQFFDRGGQCFILPGKDAARCLVLSIQESSAGDFGRIRLASSAGEQMAEVVFPGGKSVHVSPDQDQLAICEAERVVVHRIAPKLAERCVLPVADATTARFDASGDLLAVATPSDVQIWNLTDLAAPLARHDVGWGPTTARFIGAEPILRMVSNQLDVVDASGPDWKARLSARINRDNSMEPVFLGPDHEMSTDGRIVNPGSPAFLWNVLFSPDASLSAFAPAAAHFPGAAAVAVSNEHNLLLVVERSEMKIFRNGRQSRVPLRTAAEGEAVLSASYYAAFSPDGKLALCVSFGLAAEDQYWVIDCERASVLAFGSPPPGISDIGAISGLPPAGPAQLARFALDDQWLASVNYPADGDPGIVAVQFNRAPSLPPPGEEKSGVRALSTWGTWFTVPGGFEYGTSVPPDVGFTPQGLVVQLLGCNDQESRGLACSSALTAHPAGVVRLSKVTTGKGAEHLIASVATGSPFMFGTEAPKDFERVHVFSLLASNPLEASTEIAAADEMSGKWPSNRGQLRGWFHANQFIIEQQDSSGGWKTVKNLDFVAGDSPQVAWSEDEQYVAYGPGPDENCFVLSLVDGKRWTFPNPAPEAEQKPQAWGSLGIGPGFVWRRVNRHCAVRELSSGRQINRIEADWVPESFVIPSAATLAFFPNDANRVPKEFVYWRFREAEETLLRIEADWLMGLAKSGDRLLVNRLGQDQLIDVPSGKVLFSARRAVSFDLSSWNPGEPELSTDNVFAFSSDGILTLFARDDLAQIARIQVPANTKYVDVDRDKRLAITITDDNRVRTWSLPGGTLQDEIEIPSLEDWQSGCAVSCDLNDWLRGSHLLFYVGDDSAGGVAVLDLDAQAVLDVQSFQVEQRLAAAPVTIDTLANGRDRIHCERQGDAITLRKYGWGSVAWQWSWPEPTPLSISELRGLLAHLNGRHREYLSGEGQTGQAPLEGDRLWLRATSVPGDRVVRPSGDYVPLPWPNPSFPQNRFSGAWGGGGFF